MRDLRSGPARLGTWFSIVSVGVVCWLGIPALLAAQVVQLPSVGSLSVTGAVSVPDQGTLDLGGVGRGLHANGSTGIGPMATRTGSSQLSAGSATVSATIIDLQAMDEALLDQPMGAMSASARGATYTARATGVPVINTLTPHLYAHRMGRAYARTYDHGAWQRALGTAGLEEVGRANAMVGDDSEVRYYMLKAHEATLARHNAAARVYYRMAYERLSPEELMRLQAVQRRANEKQTGSSVASSNGANVAPPP